MKKGVICSIIVSVVLTLVLSVATVVTVIGSLVNSKPEPAIYLAYRTGDELTELGDYKKVDLAIDLADENSFIGYNEEGKIVAKAAGSISGKAHKQNGKVADLTIEVFTQGNGQDAETPWIIANAKHVQELSELVKDGDSIVSKPEFVCEVKADIDMAGQSFMPIGDRAHKFQGTIKGNGKTISNINIDVNVNNYADYVQISEVSSNNEAFFDLGFIGYGLNASVVDLGISNMQVTVANEVKDVIANAIANGEITDYVALRRINIGAVIAYAENCEITATTASVSSTVRAYSYVAGNMYAGIGGVVGVSYNSTISGLKVNTKVYANHEYVENVASKVGGVAGATARGTGVANLIENVEVTLTASTLYNNGSYIGGLVGSGRNLTAKNSIVNVTVNGNEKFATINTEDLTGVKGTVVGGAVAQLDTNTYSLASKVENVKVNAAVDVKAFVGGIVGINYGTVKNSVVSGNLVGYHVGGVVYNNYKDVVYNETVTENAVDVVVRGVKVGGVACYNDGNITGSVGEAKTKVVVVADSASASVPDENYAKALTEAYTAGVAAETTGTISNLDVRATLVNGINMAGIANVSNGSTISNVNVNVNVTSSNLTNNASTTYSIAGGVNYVYADSTIDHVNVIINANRDIVSGRRYAVSEMGGLVARVYEDGVTITNNEVSGSMFANASKWEATINEVSYKEMLVGGLIGSVSGRTDALDNHSGLTLSNFVVTGNKVSNLTIDIELVANSLTAETGKVVRSIGSLVGSIANENAVDLHENVVGQVTIKAYGETFTYHESELSLRGYIDNKITDFYGSAKSGVDGYSKVYNDNAEYVDRVDFIELGNV